MEYEFKLKASVLFDKLHSHFAVMSLLALPYTNQLTLSQLKRLPTLDNLETRVYTSQVGDVTRLEVELLELVDRNRERVVEVEVKFPVSVNRVARYLDKVRLDILRLLSLELRPSGNDLYFLVNKPEFTWARKSEYCLVRLHSSHYIRAFSDRDRFFYEANQSYFEQVAQLFCPRVNTTTLVPPSKRVAMRLYVSKNRKIIKYTILNQQGIILGLIQIGGLQYYMIFRPEGERHNFQEHDLEGDFNSPQCWYWVFLQAVLCIPSRNLSKAFSLQYYTPLRYTTSGTKKKVLTYFEVIDSLPSHLATIASLLHNNQDITRFRHNSFIVDGDKEVAITSPSSVEMDSIVQPELLPSGCFLFDSSEFSPGSMYSSVKEDVPCLSPRGTPESLQLSSRVSPSLPTPFNFRERLAKSGIFDTKTQVLCSAPATPFIQETGSPKHEPGDLPHSSGPCIKRRMVSSQLKLTINPTNGSSISSANSTLDAVDIYSDPTYNREHRSEHRSECFVTEPEPIQPDYASPKLSPIFDEHQPHLEDLTLIQVYTCQEPEPQSIMIQIEAEELDSSTIISPELKSPPPIFSELVLLKALFKGLSPIAIEKEDSFEIAKCRTIASGFFKDTLVHPTDPHTKVFAIFKDLSSGSLPIRLNELSLLMKFRDREGFSQISSIVVDDDQKITGFTMKRHHSTFKELLRNHRSMTPKFRLGIIYRVVCLVKELHENQVAHRDLSEVNIMVDEGLFLASRNGMVGNSRPRRNANNTNNTIIPKPSLDPRSRKRGSILNELVPSPELPTDLNTLLDESPVIIDFGKSAFLNEPFTKDFQSVIGSLPPAVTAPDLLPNLLLTTPDLGFPLYRSIVTLPRNKRSTESDRGIVFDGLKEDVFSLAILIYRILSGLMPWGGLLETSLPELRKVVEDEETMMLHLKRDLPNCGKWHMLLIKSLDPDPNSRWSTLDVKLFIEAHSQSLYSEIISLA